MTILNLLHKYQDKIAKTENAIIKINLFINEAKTGETSSDIEDLKFEKSNALIDLKQYKKFVKELKQINSDQKMLKY